MRKGLHDAGNWIIIFGFLAGCERVRKKPGERMELGWVILLDIFLR